MVLKACFIVHSQGRHYTQGVADGYSQGLASYRTGSHYLKRFHDLGDAPGCRIASIEQLIEGLARRRNDILIKTQPVYIGTAGSPWLTI